MNEFEIFRAVASLPVENRAAVLDAMCDQNRDVRAQVESLLKAHDESGGFLPQKPDRNVDVTLHSPPSIQPGSMIAGRYKLLETIGEGGMGSVWVAEQSQPVKRKVAIKLVKPGMDSRQVLARFEAERQALAMMDHPNIAKVLDGGLTDQGRPFFAMEYVKGVPLTEYCDLARLSLKDRLNLFVPVCEAVQHAHQKGIIHRDLKPTNILICLYDGKPVPKVIDFGLAKALHHSLTDQTLHTAHGMMVGTPLYMSPEQAEHNNLDVDTRTDIYSLGVILYELLTGSTPLERQQLKEAAFNEILRLIKEVEPPKPSTRLSGGISLPSIAAQRSIDPHHLRKSVSGDLDWIVMKALDKERGRRYETASGLARDVERYLHEEPVEACPPPAGYRMKKFVRRNKGPVAAAVGLLLTLSAGIVGTSLGLVHAETARKSEAEQRRIAQAREQDAVDEKAKALRAAEQERLAKEGEVVERARAEQQRQLAQEQMQRAEENEKKAIDEAAISKAVNEFLQQDLLGLADAEAQLGSKIEPDPDVKLKTLLDRALLHVDERFANQPQIRAQVQGTLAQSFYGIGRYPEAVRMREKVLEYYESTLGPEHPDTLDAMNNLATAYLAAGQRDKAMSLFEQTFELHRRIRGSEHPDAFHVMNNLALAYREAGQLDKALPLGERTLELLRKNLGLEDHRTLTAMGNLAITYHEAGRLEEARLLHEQTLELQTKIVGPEHPETLASTNNLATNYVALGQFDKALLLLERTLELRRRISGPEHPGTLSAMSNLAITYHSAGRVEEARLLNEQTLELRRKFLGPEHPNTLTSMASLAKDYAVLGQFDKALPLYEQTLELAQRILGPEHPHTLTVMGSLAMAYLRTNQPERAAPLLRSCLDWHGKRLGRESLALATHQARFAVELLKVSQWSEAEALLRESLLIREKSQPDDWTTFNTQSMLGAALLGQKKYADAEPLLVSGYEGLRQRESQIPKQSKARTGEALQRLVELYTAWDKPEHAAKWQEKLDAHQVDLSKQEAATAPVIFGKLTDGTGPEKSKVSN